MKAFAKRDSEGKADIVRVTARFDASGLTLTPTPFGVIVKLEGCVTAGEPGSPGLPTRVIHVALPPFTRAISADGEARSTVAVTGKDVLVAPVQPPRPAPVARGSIDPKFLSKAVGAVPRSSQRRPEDPFVPPFPAPLFVPPKPDLYERERAGQRPPARLLRTDATGGTPVAAIELNPVRLGSSAELLLHTEIEITIHFSAADLTRRRDTERARAEEPLPRSLRSRAQARRAAALVNRLVVNPEMVADLSSILAIEPAQVDYLIVTDTQTWDADEIRPVGGAGDLIAPFERLAAWKAKRGLRARVVTVSDIVAGAYGDFRSDARDLQEVLRSFLKWAHKTWGVAWVLLGGDVDIIPIRRVASAVLGHINVTGSDPPPDNGSFWTGRFLKMNVVNPGDWWPGPSADHLLVRPDTGRLIPYDRDGASGPKRPGWYFTTDISCEERSKEPTQYVRVNGPEREINATLQWLYEWNTLPTDLYYASLTGPGYDVPGAHDWDLLDNGIYGQHDWSADHDGVSYTTDVSVGRAPVSSPEQASAFASKVIAYEQFRSPDGSPLDMDWPRRMLLVSANFGGSIWIFPDESSPPSAGCFHHEKGAGLTLIRLREIPYDLQWNLIAAVAEGDLRLVPFDLGAASSGHGWYFAKSATDLSPSEMSFKGGGTRRRIPIPTEWVVVYAKIEELAPDHFVFDRATQDISMEGKEAVRALLAEQTPQIDLVSRLYEDELDLTPEQAAAAPVEHATAQRVCDALSAAPHFVSLSGHGSSYGCCWLDSYTAQSLANGYTTFIGYADSCFTGQIDAEDAMGEYLVQNPKGGAVAYIGSTRFSWIGVGDDFEVAFYKGLSRTYNLGVLADSRCSLVNGSSGWGVFNNWVALCLNLLGDPEMPVWTGRPDQLSVEHDPSPRKGKPFTVRVLRSLLIARAPAVTRPLAGARVHVQQGSFSASAVTGDDGSASLSLAGAKMGELEITVSHDGFIPFQGKATVVEPLWIGGVVSAILHQQGGADRTLVRLGLRDGSERSFYVRRSLPDYDLIVGAMTGAHLARKEVMVCVGGGASGGTIERFRMGTFTVPLAEVGDDEAR
jgi:hypothetical protein